MRMPDWLKCSRCLKPFENHECDYCKKPIDENSIPFQILPHGQSSHCPLMFHGTECLEKWARKMRNA